MEGSSLPALLVQLMVTETATKHGSANGDVTPTATKTPRAPDVWGSYISADWAKLFLSAKMRISGQDSHVYE